MSTWHDGWWLNPWRGLTMQEKRTLRRRARRAGRATRG